MHDQPRHPPPAPAHPAPHPAHLHSDLAAELTSAFTARIRALLRNSASLLQLWDIIPNTVAGKSQLLRRIQGLEHAILDIVRFLYPKSPNPFPNLKTKEADHHAEPGPN